MSGADCVRKDKGSIRDSLAWGEHLSLEGVPGVSHRELFRSPVGNSSGP